MTTLSLDQLIDKDIMVVNSTARNKQEVLEELGRLLEAKGYLKDVDTFIEDVYLRESEGITGIGGGVAIPHGKSKGVKQTTVAIAKLAHPNERETLDEGKVSGDFLCAVRDIDATTTHILLLQQVAILLADDSFIQAVQEAKSVDELYQLIVSHQANIQ